MREVLFWLGIAAGFLLAVWMYISMFLLPADQSPDPSPSAVSESCAAIICSWAGALDSWTYRDRR